MKFSISHLFYRNRKQQRMVLFSTGLILVILISLRFRFLQTYEVVAQRFQELWAGFAWVLTTVIWGSLSAQFNAFSPSLGFASDVMAYQAAIIAIAIPVSLVIISQISERYQSGAITREFNRQWQLRVLLCLVIIDAVLVVTYKFFVVGDRVGDLGWKLVAWLIFLLFITTNIVLFAFFNTLRRYTTKTQFLLDRLFDDVQRVLNLATKRQVSDKQLRIAQEQFVSSLEGIGDILVFETKKRRNNEPIIASLKRIQDTAQTFFSLQQSQPERFLKLLYSHDLLQLGEANEIEASLRLSFSPDKYSVGLMAIVNQFLRLREAGLEAKNLEIARLATYNPLWLAQELSQKSDHHQSIETILRTLSEVRYGSQKSQDDLAHFLSTTCYISPVFKDEFHLTYLGIFTRYFIPGVRGMIDNGSTELFKQLVRTLHESGDLKHYDDYRVDELQSFLLRMDYRAYMEANQNRQLSSKLNQLKVLTEQLWTDEQLKQCLEAFSELKNFVHQYLNTEQWAEIQKQFDELYDDLIFRFKFNHLVGLIFDVGSYCIFRDRFDYIHCLWTYLQPHDADANWLGHTVVPASLPGLFNLFFRDALAGRTFSMHWEDHHGNRRYYDCYFLLLLLREFLNSRVTTNQARQILIEGFQLPNGIYPSCLNSIQYDVDRLIPLARDLSAIAESFEILGLNRNQLNDAIEHGLIPFLESLKPKAEELIQQQLRQQSISPRKVKEFKAEFLEGYNERTSVRTLFKLFNLYEDRTGEPSDENFSRFGFSEVNGKAMFLEDWYVDYGHPGDAFGGSFGASENSSLISTIAQACTIQEDNLETILEHLGESLNRTIIITVNTDSYYAFHDSDHFETRSAEQSKNIDLPEFSGFYTYAECKIPVFQFFCSINTEAGISDEAFLILDRERLGRLVQYCPATAGEPYEVEQYVAFRIQAFAEDETLMTELLQNPPNWLLEKGTEVEQEIYLEGQVLIAVYEKFCLEIDSDFSGILIPLTPTSFDPSLENA